MAKQLRCFGLFRVVLMSCKVNFRDDQLFPFNVLRVSLLQKWPLFKHRHLFFEGFGGPSFRQK